METIHEESGLETTATTYRGRRRLSFSPRVATRHSTRQVGCGGWSEGTAKYATVVTYLLDDAFPSAHPT